MLDGREVYHVWYVRGDGARLHGAPGQWCPDGRVLFLHDGFTEPAFRARGIHSAALRWLLARERDTETSHAVGVVHAKNVAARRAVESAGFRFLGPMS
jgi:GNAT superfamily N-acetyltransferase